MVKDVNPNCNLQLLIVENKNVFIYNLLTYNEDLQKIKNSKQKIDEVIV